MRIISFNINGARSMCTKLKNGEKKGTYLNNCLTNLVREHQPDILCLQEIKSQNPETDLSCLIDTHLTTKKDYPGIFKYSYYNIPTDKKGYSGTALFCKVKPDWVSYNFDYFEEYDIGEYKHASFNKEGRLITAKFQNCVVVTSYTPNAKPELARLEERMEWEQLLRMYLKALEKETNLPVILCGDLNCAREDIDIHNPKQKPNTPGFSKQERAELTKMLEEGFTDTFRFLEPTTKKYTYWSNFANSRGNNKGWRIDMILVSTSINNLIKSSDCLNDYYGSDHCPVIAEFDFLLE